MHMYKPKTHTFRHISRCKCRARGVKTTELTYVASLNRTYAAASCQGRPCARVAAGGTGRAGGEGWMKHRGFGGDTSEACRPVRPSPTRSGSAHIRNHSRNSAFCWRRQTPEALVSTVLIIQSANVLAHKWRTSLCRRSTDVEATSLICTGTLWPHGRIYFLALNVSLANMSRLFTQQSHRKGRRPSRGCAI